MKLGIEDIFVKYYIKLVAGTLVVSEVTRLRAGPSETRIPATVSDLSLPTSTDWLWGTHNLLLTRYLGSFRFHPFRGHKDP